MNEQRTFLDVLVASFAHASNFNALDAIPPAAVLWPDPERTWEPLLPRLRQRLPMLTLGPYAPERGSGPAAWLRCMLARYLPKAPAPDKVPIVYLPGVAVEALDDPTRRSRELDMLADLRYRSVVWTGPDGRARDMAEFFRNETDGPGVNVRDDDFTRRAMLRALPVLCDMQVTRLRENAPWRARDFEDLIERDVTMLIRVGESNDLEFKSTARWDMKENKKNTVMEHVIAKTVAGFLNVQRGGTLLIGVVDDGTVCGLVPDFQCWQKTPEKQNPDQYQLWLMGHLLKEFGREFAPFVDITFHEVEDAGTIKTVCKVAIHPASWPAYISEPRCPNGNDQDEVFYLRTGNATNRLTTRQAVEYIKSRWG